MADNFLDSLASTTTLDSIRQKTYEKYKDKFKDSTEELVNSDTFLQLMVAEMTNQDPLEPTTNTEFITQLAGFSQLNYARDSSRYAMANYASSLVGKVVTATKPDGNNQITRTGVVESVTKSGDSYTLVIDGVSFDISKVTKVAPDTSAAGSAGGVSSNALADSIARASGMIGMYATVDTDNGVAVGWIDTIKVQDGKITAVLADENGNLVGEFALDKITELTYAMLGGVGDGSMGGDSTGGVEDPETPDQQVEGSEGTDGTGDATEDKQTENSEPAEDTDGTGDV